MTLARLSAAMLRKSLLEDFKFFFCYPGLFAGFLLHPFSETVSLVFLDVGQEVVGIGDVFEGFLLVTWHTLPELP